MFPKIINLTLQLVIYEVKDILNSYPDYPYQLSFSNQELRQKLITYILSRFPNYYAIEAQIITVNIKQGQPKELTICGEELLDSSNRTRSQLPHAHAQVHPR